MASLEQVITHLRFGLEQLSAKNAQHEFEHLCRRYARARICSNILPATGPVSAGGDQARDFETFRSYLAASPIANSSFIGRLSEGPVAFACTLQKGSLPSKIKSDIGTITASGTRVLSIHYFCAADVPVAKRHKLQAWARDEKDVNLDIHDGQAISENLAEPDTFWIATEYLDVPSDIFPRNSVLVDDAYEAVREKWEHTPADPHSFSDFNEIKQLLRHSSTEDLVVQDLPFWISKAQEFNTPEARREIRRKAQYEIAVARLKGFGTLSGCESDIDEYFGEIETIDSLDELDDCVLLMSFCLSAQVLGHAELPIERLAKWHTDLVRRVDKDLASQTFPSWIAYLLRMRGSLAIHVVTTSGIEFDVDEQFNWWDKLADILPTAPLFPVETFAEALSGICEFAGAHARFSALTEKVDAVLAQRIGSFAVANSCRDRAMAHHKGGRVLMAIGEIHKAKVHWFAEETLEGCILALLVLAQWYAELGLAFAGKYHALAAAYMAIRQSNLSVKARSWEAVTEAAHCDYQIGAFAGFVDLTRLAAAMHNELVSQPGYIDEHPTLKSIIYHAGVAIYLTERLCPQYADAIQERIEAIGIGDLLDGCLALIREEWGKRSDEELRASLSKQSFGLPVSDVGRSRTISWHALGIEWSVQWTNRFHETVLAEQFIACLQIIQADLVEADLCLPKTTVNVRFEVSEAESPSITPVLSSRGFGWKLSWPSHAPENIEDEFVKVLAASIMLLGSVSFKKSEQVSDILHALEDLKRNAKAMIGQPYYAVYTDLIGEEYFNAGRVEFETTIEPAPKSTVRAHPDLATTHGPGPGYTKEAAEDAIRHRYERISQLIPFTLRRLKQQADFRDTVVELQQRGWKDWHILSALFTAVMNHRAQERFGARPSLDQINAHMRQFTNTPETKKAKAVPLTAVTKEQLEFHRRGNLGAILQSWGFEIHYPAITPEVIEEFLSTRYGYWDDDVEHEAMLGV